jgi:hypothetical protein
VAAAATTAFLKNLAVRVCGFAATVFVAVRGMNAQIARDKRGVR